MDGASTEETEPSGWVGLARMMTLASPLGSTQAGCVLIKPTHHIEDFVEVASRC